MFSKKHTVLWSFLCWAAVCLLAACGGGAPGEINVSMKTFSMTLSSNTAKAGEVTFHVKNDATDIAHEFVVVKTDVAADQLPVMAEAKAVDEDELTPVDEIEDIDPGKGGDLKVNLAPGHYVLICNTEGHYQAGMYADLTVVP